MLLLLLLLLSLPLLLLAAVPADPAEEEDDRILVLPPTTTTIWTTEAAGGSSRRRGTAAASADVVVVARPAARGIISRGIGDAIIVCIISLGGIVVDGAKRFGVAWGAGRGRRGIEEAGSRRAARDAARNGVAGKTKDLLQLISIIP
jgi:hypothetical protein